MITKEQNQQYIGKLKTLLSYLLAGKIDKDQHHRLTRELYNVYVMGVAPAKAKADLKEVTLEDIKNF